MSTRRLVLRTMVWAVLALALGMSQALAGQALARQAQGTVRIDGGRISGVADGVAGGAEADAPRAYLGIPYAAPPVGALRWRPPQAPAAWKGVRPCRAFGPACPQPRQKEDGDYSEDCLYLNVWTPAQRPGARLPVMVWIHGGAFNFGASSLPEYHGANLAKQGVVVVTVNYRLGPLGFLVHPELDRESARGVSGNYGLLDQLAALKWVRRNIKVFGGDPGKVTIFGQSAGSRSVSLQLLSPLSAGLFHRAIAQSGGPIIGSEYLSPAFNGDRAAVSRMGQELGRRLGCGAGPQGLAAMRAKSAREVVAAAACSTSIFTEGLFFAPVFDGVVLPRDPVAALRAGRLNRVPVMAGSTANEGMLYLMEEKDLNQAKYEDFLAARFGAQAGAARAMFPAAGDAEVPGAIDRVITVGANAQPARFTARAFSRGGRAFLFQFSRVPGTQLARRLGAFHGVDLAYVFGNMAQADGYDATDFALSRQVMGYWVNFAKNGDPNGPGLPRWPAYAEGAEDHMGFGLEARAGTGLHERECDFIETQWGGPGNSQWERRAKDAAP